MGVKDILREALRIMWQQKIAFGAIIVLHLLFFIFAGMAFFFYSQELVASLQEVSDYLNEQHWMLQTPTQENLASLNIPATDPNVLASGRDRMLHSTQFFFLQMGILYLAFFGAAWALTYRMIERLSLSQMAHRYARMVLVSSAYLLVLFFLLYSIVSMMSSQFLTADAPQTYLFMLPLFLVALLLYFMPVSLSLSLQGVLMKHILPQTIHHGIRNSLFLFSLQGALWVFMGALLWLMMHFLAISLLLTLLLGVSLLKIMAYARILMMLRLRAQ